MYKVYSYFLGFIFLCLSPTIQASEYSSTIQTFKSSQQTQPFFNNAYGYAVFPYVGKAGMFVGGSFGKGIVYRGGKARGDTDLIQLTVGFQLGGQVYSQIVFFEDKRAFDEFTSGSFEFGAQASAVALTIGASAQAGTTGVGAQAGGKQLKAQYLEGYAVFTSAKGGLMYEASIGGQTFTYSPY